MGSGLAPLLIAAALAATLSVGLLLVVVTRCRHQVPETEALVRSGGPTPGVYIGCAVLVMPVLHQASRVSLAPVRLALERSGSRALEDKARTPVDVALEIEVRVAPTAEGVLAAWRSLDPRPRWTPEAMAPALRDLYEAQLVAAVREVVARDPLADLERDRATFVGRVAGLLRDDLGRGGLTLCGVTVTRLERSRPRA